MTLASFVNRYEEHGGGDLALVLVDVGGRAAVGADRRGGDARRLRARVLALGGAHGPLRRVAQPLPRLRPRLLPAGPRGRPQGRHRRLPRHPPPRDRDAARTPRSGSRPTSTWRRSGTAACRASAPRREAGASARCAPRPSATPRPRRRTRKVARARGAAPASSRRGLAETRESLSWRLSAPLRGVGAGAMIAFGSVARRRGGLPALRRARHPPRRRARLRGPRARGGRQRLPRLQPAARRRRGARRPRGARDRRRAHRDRRPRLLRHGARGARATREVALAGPVGARGVETHRVVAGRGQQRAGRAPLLRARRRRDGRLRLGARPRAAGRGRRASTASCSCCPRGRSARCASTSRSARATATTSTLPAGARGRPQGGHRGPARDPPPRARAGGGPRGLDRGPHRRGREVGRPLARPRGGEVDWKRRARRAEAEREAARTVAYSSANRLDAEVLALERELAAMTDEPLVAAHGAAAVDQPRAPRC